MNKKFWILSNLIIVLLLAACSQGNDSADADLTSRPIRAVATTGMIGDAIQNVGGERVTVSSLMGPGVDPHLYKASEGDVNRLSNADVIFYNGLHLEAKMGEVLEQMGGRTKTVAVSNGIDETQLLTPPEFKGAYDPHIWFDVALWMNTVNVVKDTLVEMDPGSADLYRANAQEYLAELEQLDQYVKEQASRLPEDKRVLITAHDAFNYFGQAYGFDVRGLQGISTAAEAGTEDVQALADFIVDRHIPAIFIESSVPVRTIEAVQAAVKSRGFEVMIGGQLFSDAMGDEGTEEGTYIGMVRHNVDTIVNALLGQ